MEDIQGEIRAFLVNELGRPANNVADSDSLLEAGILDSVGVLSLVAFLESRYALKIDDEDMMPDNFDTLRAVTEFVVRRRAEQSA